MSDNVKDLLTFWLDNAGKYPLLTEEEMISLSRSIHTYGEDSPKGKKAVDKIVRHNLRLVPMVTKRILHPGKDFKFGDPHTIDLLQAGTFGLHRAAQKFDYQRGYKFSTYAFMWIRQTVQRQMYMLSSMMHVPENYFRLQDKMDDRQFWQEIKEKGGNTHKCTLAAYKAMKPLLPIYLEGENGEHLLRYDPSLSSQPNDLMDSVEDVFALAKGSIDPLHKQIVIDVCCSGMSITQVAEMSGISRHAASKILNSTLKALKRNFSVMKLKADYFS